MVGTGAQPPRHPPPRPRCLAGQRLAALTSASRRGPELVRVGGVTDTQRILRPSARSTGSPTSSSTTTPALDPIAATYFGFAGYDDQLPDLTPDGFAAREQLARDALATMQAVRPVDEREQAAKDSFVERLTVTLDQYDASDTAVAGQRDHERAALRAQRLRPDADRRPRSTGTTSPPGSPAPPQALDGYRRRCRQRPTRATSRPSASCRPSSSRSRAGPATTAPSVRASSTTWSHAADVDDALAG